MHDTRDDVLLDLSNPGRSQFKLMTTGESALDGSPAVAALIFDSANRGVYTSNAVVNLARDLGWTDAPAIVPDTVCGDLYEDWDVESAEDYLNELTPDGYAFGFSDDDFFLANDAWWEIAQ